MSNLIIINLIILIVILLKEKPTPSGYINLTFILAIIGSLIFWAGVGISKLL